VLSTDDVEDVKSAGGSLIVSPDTNEEVIRRTRALSMASYPGVFTPTEAFRAIRAGADGLKFFPAEVLGAAGIKAMKAVLPREIPVYAVGGANPDNFREYFAAGCAGFGLGSYIFKPGMALDEIAQRAKAAVAAYDEGRKQ
jgi:2-dehydro-3-deoxyphosphogalactonate aldolase